jgi:hypothetical protein
MAKINGIETEWTQILRKHGILPEEEKEEKSIDPEDYKSDQQKRYDLLAGKSLDQLDEVDEREFIDDEEERMFEELKQMRLNQMKEKVAKQKYTSGLREISAPEYTNEIKCGVGEYVVIHLYVHG